MVNVVVFCSMLSNANCLEYITGLKVFFLINSDCIFTFSD